MKKNSRQYDPKSYFQIDRDENTNDGVVITKYLGSRKKVRIPPSIQNKPVTGIGKEAFGNCVGITKVTIPDIRKTARFT